MLSSKMSLPFFESYCLFYIVSLLENLFRQKIKGAKYPLIHHLLPAILKLEMMPPSVPLRKRILTTSITNTNKWEGRGSHAFCAPRSMELHSLRIRISPLKCKIESNQSFSLTSFDFCLKEISSRMAQWLNSFNATIQTSLSSKGNNPSPSFLFDS